MKKLFSVKECATPLYWFAHWCAVNLTAANLGVWKWKYLLHDIEKPFLMFLWNDHERVQKWHVQHSKHHEQGKAIEDVDRIEQMLDWEANHLSKEFAQRTAREYYEYRKAKGKFCERECELIEAALDELGL